MSYITNKTLRKKFEAALSRTIRFIRKNPFFIISESDLKCYLYSELLKEPAFRKKFSVEGFEIPLLHTEYNFVGRFGRGLRDIAILNCNQIGKNDNDYIDNQIVLIGCELKLKWYRSLENIRFHLDSDASTFKPPKNKSSKDSVEKFGYVFFIHYARKKSDDTKVSKIVSHIKKMRLQNPSVKYYFLEISEDNKRAELIYPIK